MSAATTTKADSGSTKVIFAPLSWRCCSYQYCLGVATFTKLVAAILWHNWHQSTIGLTKLMAPKRGEQGSSARVLLVGNSPWVVLQRSLYVCCEGRHAEEICCHQSAQQRAHTRKLEARHTIIHICRSHKISLKILTAIASMLGTLAIVYQNAFNHAWYDGAGEFAGFVQLDWWQPENVNSALERPEIPLESLIRNTICCTCFLNNFLLTSQKRGAFSPLTLTQP